MSDITVYRKENLPLQENVPGAKMWAVALDRSMLTWFELAPDTVFPEHSHESEQITTVLEGELTFIYNGKTAILKAGDVIAIPSNAVHAAFTGSLPCKAVDAWSPPRGNYHPAVPRKSVEILEATAADATEILALQKLAYLSEAELYGDFNIPPLTQTLDEIRAEFAKRIFLKAVEDGSIIGSVQGFRIAGTCFVGRLMVHPERQGKGIGTRLMAAIEAAFPDAERFELFTGHRSFANIRLYERVGYRIFRTEKVSPALSLVFMEKCARR